MAKVGSAYYWVPNRMLTAADLNRHAYNSTHNTRASRYVHDPGHLHLGAQTKSTYFSPTYFATLGREVHTTRRPVFCTVPAADADRRFEISIVFSIRRADIVFAGILDRWSRLPLTLEPSHRLRRARWLEKCFRIPLSSCTAIYSKQCPRRHWEERMPFFRQKKCRCRKSLTSFQLVTVTRF